jgi:SAM-dependent methyltransferase
MNKFIFVTKELLKGKSLLRAYLNYSLIDRELKGKTIDIGGGGSSNYLSFIKRSEDVTFETFDLKVGQEVDFEKDSLPSQSDAYDTVLFLNVMEHIFNYQHIANEVVRILKPGGQMIGFVPFLMWYHPDHKDFFRYTHEALEIIFARTGAINIEIVPIQSGPFIAAAQMMILPVPKFLRIFVFTPCYILDKIYSILKRRRQSKERYILGYVFTASK